MRELQRWILNHNLGDYVVGVGEADYVAGGMSKLHPAVLLRVQQLENLFVLSIT